MLKSIKADLKKVENRKMVTRDWRHEVESGVGELGQRAHAVYKWKD